jgi:hypothetical protein
MTHNLINDILDPGVYPLIPLVIPNDTKDSEEKETSQKEVVSSKPVKASRFTGVFRAGKKWKSQIQQNGVQHYLGIFENEEDASEAYLQYKANHLASSSASDRPSLDTRKKRKSTTLITTSNASEHASREVQPESLSVITSNSAHRSLLQYLAPSVKPGEYVMRIEEGMLDELKRKMRLGEYLNSI